MCKCMMEKVLEVENLTKIYSSERAVDGISFGVRSGEIVGLLGPNGAGKTTTISMVLGILEPTSGIIRIFGKDLVRDRVEILERVNFSAAYAELPGNLMVESNLLIFARLYGISNVQEKVKKFLEEFDLQKFARSRTGWLSSGEKSRLNLAKAFLNEPKLLLLDEPTASLDPSSSDIIRKRIRAYVERTGAAVLWTSHDMYEIEEMCDRVLFISHGKIFLEGDPRKLPIEYGKKNLEELFIAAAREPLSLHPLHT